MSLVADTPIQLDERVKRTLMDGIEPECPEELRRTPGGSGATAEACVPR
jgi:hypothetical protein